MAHYARQDLRNAGTGGVAGVSPAEGGVPAISAPARGKAFPHLYLDRLVVFASPIRQVKLIKTSGLCVGGGMDVFNVRTFRKRAFHELPPR
jgi:hypothetical protein